MIDWILIRFDYAIRWTFFMTDNHREVYQPSFEGEPTYNLQDDEEDDARSRLPLLIVIALLVLASFVGVVWLAYNQSHESGLVASPAFINAPDVPIRTLPPENTADVPYTGLKIYNDPIPPDEEAEDSNLASTLSGAVLQIGAYPSEDLALESWETFQAQHTAFASRLTLSIQRVDLAENGIWHRVRVGPFVDDVSASAACENLMANGGSCFVAAP